MELRTIFWNGESIKIRPSLLIIFVITIAVHQNLENLPHLINFLGFLHGFSWEQKMSQEFHLGYPAL